MATFLCGVPDGLMKSTFSIRTTSGGGGRGLGSCMSSRLHASLSILARLKFIGVDWLYWLCLCQHYYSSGFLLL